MAPDSTFFTSGLSSFSDWIKLIAGIVSILGGLVAIAVVFFTRFLPWCQDRRKRRSLANSPVAELYTLGNIEQATRYDIEPDCQNVDPSGGEDARLVYGVRQNLFEAIDNALYHPTAESKVEEGEMRVSVGCRAFGVERRVLGDFDFGFRIADFAGCKEFWRAHWWPICLFDLS